MILRSAGPFPYPERVRRHHLSSGMTKSAGCAVGEASPPTISSDMKVNRPAGSFGEIASYIQLQRQIHDALREQHPEWIEKNGDCPTCESYESRFAELLSIFQSHERQSAA